MSLSVTMNTSESNGPRSMPSRAEDISACRALLHQGSLTFYAASLLLPRAVRDPASALYAFCRLADDAVDDSGGAPGAVEALRQRLDRAYRGQPGPVPADRALAAVVAAYDIPFELPDALIEGFAWDAAGRRYETLADLEDYAARVAGTVGAMMALLMGVRDEAGLSRACDLGVAMQLSNIARDVGEDARMGRLYLPREWMRDAGLDPDAWLAAPVHGPALAAVVRRVLDAADRLYDRVRCGIAQLPLSCRPGINAARYLYAEIGHEVARRGCDSVSQRAVVAGRRKAQLLLRSLVSVPLSTASEPTPALAATRYLVDAAMRSQPPSGPQGELPWWRPRARAVWMIDLFERVEHRRWQRLGHAQRGEDAPPGRARWTDQRVVATSLPLARESAGQARGEVRLG